MQAIRPRVLTTPLQFGLAVQLHHKYSSKLLIDTLHALGYCSSYNAVRNFEYCAAVDKTNTILQFDPTSQCLRFAADNVDHNISTLRGHDTFHEMGQIAILTKGAFT